MERISSLHPYQNFGCSLVLLGHNSLTSAITGTLTDVCSVGNTDTYVVLTTVIFNEVFD